MRVLAVDLESQDMAKMMDVLGKDYEVGSYSANNGALACAEDFIPMVQKGDVANVPAIYAAECYADTAETTEIEVPVWYVGDAELTTVRLAIESDLPVLTSEDSDVDGGAVVTSANDFEYNPDTNEIIIYAQDGKAIDPQLFTITYDLADVEDSGKYPVTLTLLEATGADAELVDLVGGIGYVTIKGSEIPGDVNQDGVVDNRDLIMIARYLVDLEEFDFDQKKLADYNGDGEINNTDLVLIARALVEKAEA
jgi:hypothetical protein